MCIPNESERRRKTGYRLDWASLLSRIFHIDGMTCAQCNGKLRVVAKVENLDAVAAMWRYVRLDPNPHTDPTMVASECGL